VCDIDPVLEDPGNGKTLAFVYLWMNGSGISEFYMEVEAVITEPEARALAFSVALDWLDENKMEN